MPFFPLLLLNPLKTDICSLLGTLWETSLVSRHKSKYYSKLLALRKMSGDSKCLIYLFCFLLFLFFIHILIKNVEMIWNEKIQLVIPWGVNIHVDDRCMFLLLVAPSLHGWICNDTTIHQPMYQPLSHHMHEKFVNNQKGDNVGRVWVICDLLWIINEKMYST